MYQFDVYFDKSAAPSPHHVITRVNVTPLSVIGSY